LRRRRWLALCALEIACASARGGEDGRAPAGAARLLDRLDAWTIESPWSPRPAAAPESELRPAFAAEFEEGEAAQLTPVELPASFAGRSLRPGVVLPPEPPPRPSAQAAARGARGLRFAHAAGAAFVVVPVTPDTPYLLSCLVRRGVDPRAFAAGGADPAGEAAALLARLAQAGSLVVYELHQRPPPDASPAELLAAFGARENAIVATHVVPAAETTGRFGESRLVLRVSVFTHALALGLIGGAEGWWALPESSHPDGDPPEGAIDFDSLRLYELRARDYLPLQQTSAEEDLPPPPLGAAKNDGFARKVKLLGDVRRALLAPAGTTASVPLTLPAGRFRIALSYGVIEERRAAFGTVPITFVARLEREGAPAVELLHERVTAADSAAARAWHECWFDWKGGGPARLVLAASSEAKCDDVAVFGEPVVAALREPAELPRSVVLISVDTLRSDRVGCYGYARADGAATTPAIDALAAESLRFANARSVAPFTLPSHATILTGLLPRAHGVVRHGRRLVADVQPLLAVDFARAGYATAAFTGGAYLSYEHGFHHGFDRYSILDPFLTDEDPYRDAFPRPGDRAFNDAAYATCDERSIERWLDATSGRPFFLFVHTYAAHDYRPPKELERRFVRGDLARLGPDRDLKKIERAAASAGAPVPADVAEVASDLYDGAVAAADRSVGELIGALRARGLLERTVVVLLSDHGEEFGEHGGLLHGRTVYEEVLRVPLLLRAPGVAPGVVEAPVDLCDVAPTLRALCRLAPAACCDGADLLRRVADDDFKRAFWAEVAAPGLSRRRALLAGADKLIESPAAGFEERDYARVPPPPLELYDLKGDPRERRDRVALVADAKGGGLVPADEQPERPLLERLRKAAAQLRAALNEERARLLQGRDALDYRPGASSQAQLKALAYPGGASPGDDDD
jgi:arylsulfatase A-like enzyme